MLVEKICPSPGRAIVEINLAHKAAKVLFVSVENGNLSEG